MQLLTQAARHSLERGLTWMTRHLDLFLPDDAFNPEKLKEFAELSILYGCLATWRLGAGYQQLETIKGHLFKFLSDPGIAEWVRKLPAYYSPYLVAYLPVRSTGIRIPEMEGAALALRRAGYPYGLEMTPYRELELQYLSWKGGVSRKPPAWGAVFRRTTLARCRNPVYFSLPEVYSVTHTLFYLTDIAGPARIAEADRKLAIQVVEPLTLHYWRKPDWDLTSELLLNLIGLDRFDTALFNAAFEAVHNSWRTEGFLPGPSFAELPQEPPRTKLFEYCYHTTLVALMLCGAYLHRTAGPEALHANA